MSLIELFPGMTSDTTFLISQTNKKMIRKVVLSGSTASSAVVLRVC